MNMNLIDVAEIVNTHGLKGEVKIYPRTDYNEFFEEISGVYLADGTYYKINNVKYHKNTVILKLKGVNSVEEAELLRSKVLYVKREMFDSLPEGTYLIADIIGLEVFEGDVCYGKIKDVIQTGSNDVYELVSPNGDSILIPALKDVIEKIDLENSSMTVKLPEGLLD